MPHSSPARRIKCAAIVWDGPTLGLDVDEGRDADALGRRHIQHIDANLLRVLRRLPHHVTHQQV
jgi:hypothetical protein